MQLGNWELMSTRGFHCSHDILQDLNSEGLMRYLAILPSWRLNNSVSTTLINLAWFFSGSLPAYTLIFIFVWLGYIAFITIPLLSICTGKFAICASLFPFARQNIGFVRHFMRLRDKFMICAILYYCQILVI